MEWQVVWGHSSVVEKAWEESEKKTKGKEGMGRKTGQREASVLRYKEKRQSRLFSKRIRYEVRKLNAEKRPRMKVLFIPLFMFLYLFFPHLTCASPAVYFFSCFNFHNLLHVISVAPFWIGFQWIVSLSRSFSPLINLALLIVLQGRFVKRDWEGKALAGNP